MRRFLSQALPSLSSVFVPDSLEDLTQIDYKTFLLHLQLLNDSKYRFDSLSFVHSFLSIIGLIPFSPFSLPNRYFACWHRSPLFFCHNAAIRSNSTAAVHWSPLAAYLPRQFVRDSTATSPSDYKDIEDGLVMVIDVNQSYGPFFVSPRRLFDCVNLRDYTGSYLGLLRLQVATD
jgi:hypothetical protein